MGEYGGLSVVPLNNGYSVVVDPDTMFWILVEPSQIGQARAQLREIYTDSLRQRLKADIDWLTTCSAVDLVEIHPTSACNMNCSYCYVPQESRNHPGSIMQREHIEQVVAKVLDWVEKNGGMKRFIFHGGEPLLVRDHFFPIIDRYYRDVEFAIQTNGTLLTEDDARFIKERNTHISLSLDALSAETNDKLRRYRDGRGTFDDVRRAIDLFRDFEWQGVIVTITKHNVDQLDLIARAFYDWGVRSALFNPVSPSCPNAVDLMPSPQDLITGYKKLIDALIELNGKISTKRLVVDNVESLAVAIFTSNMRVLYCHMSPCGAGRLALVVTPNGDIYPCSEFIRFQEFKCGNVFTDSLPDILSSKACEVLEARNTASIDECRSCAFRLICGANCPAAVYGLYGTLQAKSPYCTFMKAIISYMFEKISEHGIDVAYRLVSRRFEDMLRESERLVCIGQVEAS